MARRIKLSASRSRFAKYQKKGLFKAPVRQRTSMRSFKTRRMLSVVSKSIPRAPLSGPYKTIRASYDAILPNTDVGAGSVLSFQDNNLVSQAHNGTTIWSYYNHQERGIVWAAPLSQFITSSAFLPGVPNQVDSRNGDKIRIQGCYLDLKFNTMRLNDAQSAFKGAPMDNGLRVFLVQCTVQNTSASPTGSTNPWIGNNIAKSLAHIMYGKTGPPVYKSTNETTTAAEVANGYEQGMDTDADGIVDSNEKEGSSSFAQQEFFDQNLEKNGTFYVLDKTNVRFRSSATTATIYGSQTVPVHLVARTPGLASWEVDNSQPKFGHLYLVVVPQNWRTLPSFSYGSSTTTVFGNISVSGKMRLDFTDQ